MGFDKEYGYVCKIGRQVGIRESKKYTWRNPDLICVHEDFGFIIVELDGAVHDRKVEKTRARNELYKGAGIKLVVINIADTKELGKTILESAEEGINWIISSHSS